MSDSNDYYVDENGQVVFTKEFHLKRGYCCECGCKHCPYTENEKELRENVSQFE